MKPTNGPLPNSNRSIAPRRIVRAFVSLAVPALVFLAGSGTEARAEHCGRVDMAAIWADSRPSWEQDRTRFETGRIRSSECEGPLCRSRTPQPFAQPTTVAGVMVSQPWNSTSLRFALSPDPLAGSISPDFALNYPAPYYVPIFEPPRGV